jgi:3-dehydroquinate dehydratase/shikimate dehydrogenase
MAKERGAEVIPGIEMFVHQAARQFEIWTGKPAPWDDMMRVVSLALQERTSDLGRRTSALGRRTSDQV